MTIRTYHEGLLGRIESERAVSLVYLNHFLQSEQIVRDLVMAARDDAATWEEIGDALGVTRQAAQQRYGGS